MGKAELDVVDKIAGKDIDKSTKIIRLVSVAVMNHRQPLGDKAWGAVRDITDGHVVTALAFLLGYTLAGDCIKVNVEKMRKLVPELEEEG